MTIEICCDGSCIGNPGPGGWAAVIQEDDGSPRVLSGGEPHTTNNRMELLAVIRALEALDPETPALVLCDSRYVVNGINVWIQGWKARGWKTAANKPVKNADLWKRLDALRAARPAVRFDWVAGHAGHPGNERADQEALREAEFQAGAAPTPSWRR